MHIYVDADACPVKEEVYRVARRYAWPVTLVANAPQRIPDDERFTLIVVREGMDVADDWIAEHAGEGDIVITADIPLAARCVRNGARVIGTTGRPFTEDNVGGALATRDILSELRGAGAFTPGPPPFEKRDRSRFLQALDTAIQAIRQERLS
ncbi:MAG: YaiI/YqxD family protein [Acidobacteriota bacterium]|nr:YaiI/YqxD family protein [Acidobacteriota bacterium]